MDKKITKDNLDKSDKLKCLRELHKENSLFLNKAMLAIPAVSAPILLRFLSQGCGLWVSILIIGGAACFTLSVLMLLYSCFLSEEAIDHLTSGNQDSSMKLNNKLKLYNKLSFWCIVSGFILAFVSIIFFQINKEKTAMANSKSNSMVGVPGVAMDGMSIPMSLYSKKELPIPQNNPNANNETVSPRPSKPAENSTNSKK